jgi:hypothetical protein
MNMENGEHPTKVGRPQFGDFSLRYIFFCQLSAIILLISLIITLYSKDWSLIDFLLPFLKIPSNLTFEQEALYIAAGDRMFAFVGMFIPLVVASPGLVAAMVGISHPQSLHDRRAGLASLGLLALFWILWAVLWKYIESGWPAIP